MMNQTQKIKPSAHSQSPESRRIKTGKIKIYKAVRNNRPAEGLICSDVFKLFKITLRFEQLRRQNGASGSPAYGIVVQTDKAYIENVALA